MTGKRNRNKNNILIYAFIAILFISIVGCSDQDTAVNPRDIKVAAVSPQIITGEITISGILDAENSANLTAQLSGTIVSVETKEGSNIGKGETMITFDKRELKIQLEQAQANLLKSQEGLNQAQIALHDAELEFTRYQELFKAGVISQKELEQTTTKRELAKSQLETQKSGVASAANSVKLIELNISKIDLKSPFSGTVSTCSVSPGETVSMGTPLASVVSVDHLVLTGSLSQSLVNYVKQGQQVEVQAEVIPGKTFTGEVIFVSPISITTGQFFPIKISIVNNDRLLRAGMSGLGRIKIEEEAPLAIPKTAIFQQGGQDYVYITKEGKATKEPVKIGITGEQYSSILSGLELGDKVIAEGASQVLEGDPIDEGAPIGEASKVDTI